MIVLDSFYKKQDLGSSNLSIGVFDGLHLGHALVLKKLKEKEGKSIVFTFENHPLDILKPDIKIQKIYEKQDTLKYLKSFDIDVVIMIKFDKNFADISYIDFFKILKENFSFTNLIVGKDVKIGKDGKGDLNKIKSLENILNFKSEFIEKIKYENRVISSRWIRSLIEEKNYVLAEKLLNRKFL
ncbi:MAG: Riboflavin biosynthesis protein RibF [Candidatus Anoxychlamydiales bacterium]|nr:Riboflavin biosynthesis protein RibF [Candidatus Anoxychlamydiales bacterium]